MIYAIDADDQTSSEEMKRKFAIFDESIKNAKVKDKKTLAYKRIKNKWNERKRYSGTLRQA